MVQQMNLPRQTLEGRGLSHLVISHPRNPSRKEYDWGYVEPAYSDRPLSTRQRNAISMAFRWWADGCLFQCLLAGFLFKFHLNQSVSVVAPTSQSDLGGVPRPYVLQ